MAGRGAVKKHVYLYSFCFSTEKSSTSCPELVPLSSYIYGKYSLRYQKYLTKNLVVCSGSLQNPHFYTRRAITDATTDCVVDSTDGKGRKGWEQFLHQATLFFATSKLTKYGLHWSS